MVSENMPEPIAIIGMACRFPGGASEPSRLWEALSGGKSAWNIAGFDCNFFEIKPTEAKALDPQQRLSLELAYEAFENAGLTLKELWGSKTGVYVGQWSSDYSEILARDPEHQELYHTLGIGPAITSNRVSYFFNLRGPSFTVDTGCSASLVALHNAVQSLRAGESTMSVVSGVNLLLDPQRFTYQSKLKMFSPDGRSFSFDERANGYGRGEGCGTVVLKPLSQALKDGDRVRAIIRNTALNQDGRTPAGISVPSGEAQEEVIRAAYSEVGLPTTETDYVEAHGTGTAVGDPIEASAIANVLARTRNADQARLIIGSVKGNIGHTESAAGIAGVIKSVLMLENQAMPPQVNYERPNKAIPLDDWNLEIPTTFEPKEINRISVNSFGYGGTNAHVILDRVQENGQLNGANGTAEAVDRPRVFIISGAEESSCHMNAENLAQYLEDSPTASQEGGDDFMDRLALSVNRRTVHDHSSIVVAYDQDDLLTQLDILQQTPITPNQPLKGAQVGFVFGGQGAQYHNMGREMIKDWPVFRQSLDRANAHIRTLGSKWDIVTELSHEKAQHAKVDEPEYGQLLSTAIQLALVDTLTALNVTPTSVVGHSSGEIAAGYAVGALSFEDALTVSYHRGRLTSKLIATGVSGGMLAVGAAPEVAQTYVDQVKNNGASDIKIACYNSPASVTISGSNDAIEAVSDLLQKDDVFNRKLKTQGAAYHSQMMSKIEEEYLSAISSIQPRPMAGNMVSSLTGKKLPEGYLLKGEYWVQNLTSPVLFAGALKGMIHGEEQDGKPNASDVSVILEVGPHAQMQGAVKETLKDMGPSAKVHYISCLQRKHSAAETMLRALAGLFTVSVPVNLHYANAGFNKQLPTILHDLPPYAFNHDTRHWHDGRISRDFTHRQFGPHELLGNLSTDVNPMEPRWRRYLRLKELPWLRQHVVQGEIVFPAAAYLAMAMEAMRRAVAYKVAENAKPVVGYSLSKCSFSRALVLNDNDTEREIISRFDLRLRVQRARGETGRSSACSRHHQVRSGLSIAEDAYEPLQTLHTLKTVSGIRFDVKEKSIAAIPHHITPTRFYTTANQVGMDWHSPFDNIVALQGRTDSCVATNKMPTLQAASHPFGESTYVVHPGLLDSTMFHGICASVLVERAVKAPVVPTFIESMMVSTAFEVATPGTELKCYGLAVDAGTSWSAQVEAAGGPMMSIHGMRLAELPGNIEVATSRQLAHSPEWVKHCPSMARDQIIADCEEALDDKSARQLNNTITAEVRSHVERAVKQIKPEEVEAGYKQYWYQWMKDLVAEPFEATHSKLTERDEKESDSAASFEAVRLLGENLVDLLKGDAEPVALMGAELLGKLYSEPRNHRCYKQINKYCKTRGLHNPSLKVLEVGGGTASATVPLLEALTHNGQALVSQYDFTDLSTAFFPAASKILSQYAHFMNYQQFDIEKDPEAQGFELGTYDIIIACNVVHATPSIAHTCNNLRQLLNPGGTLILMELTKLEPIYNIIFGSLSGWWAGVDEGRTSSAIISPDDWKVLLKDNGFQANPVMASDYVQGEGESISVIFAQNPEIPQRTLSDISLHVASGVFSAKADSGFAGVADKLRKNSKLGFKEITAGGLDSVADIASTVLVLDPKTCEALSGEINDQRWTAFQEAVLNCKAVLMVTRGATGESPEPLGAMTLGFARTLRLEQPSCRYITLDLDTNTSDERLVDTLAELLSSTSFDFDSKVNDVDTEFAERNGQLTVNRLFHNAALEQQIVRSTAKSTPEPTTFLDTKRPMRVELGVSGVLETFRWVDDHEQARALTPDEIRIESRAASINFRDVLIATGELSGSATMMNDCAGVVVEVGKNMRSRYSVGDRVTSYYAQSYNNYPIVHGEDCARIPDNVSFALGASLPIVWATVYHSLANVAKLQKGETILVHAAAGAVGQAAVIMAQHLGAEVYATCGSQEKRDFLGKMGVPEDHIFTSRSTSFGPALRRATGQKGVNVILNSLAGEMFRESLECLASFGRFVEIGKKDFLDDSLMPTRFLLRNITFACVDLVQMIDEDKPLVQSLLQDVVELVASEKYNNVSIHEYKLNEIEAAFRLISAGKHIGKVILTVDPGDKVQALPALLTAPPLSADASYILVGGFGGLGMRIIRWLAARGAKKIVTLSRSGDKSPSARSCISELKKDGINIMAKACDISSRKAVEAVVSELKADTSVGPIRGVINAAMALEDTTFEKMTHEQWATALGPKVAGTWNLHECLPSDMEFFIALSSIAGVSGHTAQSNYTAACTFQDAFASYRRSLGLSGYSIDVGVVGDAGFVSEAPAVLAVMQRQGFSTIAVAELLATLDHILIKSGTESQATLGLIPEAGVNKADWLEQRRLAHLVQDAAFAGNAAGGDSGSDLIDPIKRAKTPEEALEAVGAAVLGELSKLTVTPVDRILPHRTLDSYGVDSLVTVEFRNWVVAMLSADVSLLLIREAGSIEELIRSIATRSKAVPVKLQEGLAKLT